MRGGGGVALGRGCGGVYRECEHEGGGADCGGDAAAPGDNAREASGCGLRAKSFGDVRAADFAWLARFQAAEGYFNVGEFV